MARPVIRKSDKAAVTARFETLVQNLVRRVLIPEVKRNHEFFRDKLDSPSCLLELRKVLRSEVNAALSGDDRVMAAAADDTRHNGHEPMIALLALLIHFHMDARLHELLCERW